MDLVPLRVRIGLRANGQADHPDFNRLPTVVAAGTDWSYYVDSVGGGWHYDKQSGHQHDDVGSPRGVQIGCLLVPEAFADEAVAMFPGICEEITEAQFELFHDNRAHAHEPEIHEDVDVLQAIALKEQLGIPRTPQDDRALDPDDPQTGRKRNRTKTWAGRKAEMGITIATNRLRVR